MSLLNTTKYKYEVSREEVTVRSTEKSAKNTWALGAFNIKNQASLNHGVRHLLTQLTIGLIE